MKREGDTCAICGSSSDELDREGVCEECRFREMNHGCVGVVGAVAILILCAVLACCTSTVRKEPQLPLPTKEEGQRILHAWFLDYDMAGDAQAVPSKEAESNLKWLREKYLDVPLTRKLNEPQPQALRFEQPSLLPITYNGEERYQLVEDWGFPFGEHWIVVPKGGVYDGASVPRACWSFMPRDGRHRAGALAHDQSYELAGVLAPDLTITRQEADAMLRDMMERAGVGKVTSSIVYASVRAFGGSSWGAHSPIILPVKHRMYAPRFIPPRNSHSHIYAP